MRPFSEQPVPEPRDRELTPDEAFDDAVRTHYARLSRFAFRILKSWDAAEDAVQQALFKCWTRRDSINLPNPLAYFYMAVANRLNEIGIDEIAYRMRQFFIDEQRPDAQSGQLAGRVNSLAFSPLNQQPTRYEHLTQMQRPYEMNCIATEHFRADDGGIRRRKARDFDLP